jgi:hypothetical protein
MEKMKTRGGDEAPRNAKSSPSARILRRGHEAHVLIRHSGNELMRKGSIIKNYD